MQRRPPPPNYTPLRNEGVTCFWITVWVNLFSRSDIRRVLGYGVGKSRPDFALQMEFTCTVEGCNTFFANTLGLLCTCRIRVPYEDGHALVGPRYRMLRQCVSIVSNSIGTGRYWGWIIFTNDVGLLFWGGYLPTHHTFPHIFLITMGVRSG